MATILLIEDNDLNRDMLTRYLRLEGFDVLAVSDGTQGIALTHDKLPDLILMDLSLPVIDGWETTRQIKADQATAHIPVIALTAHAMIEDRERSIAAGCDEFETKPVDFPRLLGKIRGLLAAR